MLSTMLSNVVMVSNAYLNMILLVIIPGFVLTTQKSGHFLAFLIDLIVDVINFRLKCQKKGA